VRHAKQWPATLESYVYPAIGALPVRSIETGHVTSIIEPLWSAKPETASRVRGRIESVLNYAKVHGWREGDNPARWRGHLENVLPKRSKMAPVVHHAALPWNEIGGFMEKLTALDSVPAMALRFAILTAARSGEVMGARWSEIDFAAKVWTIPPHRMKAGQEHRVPLSDDALAILAKATDERGQPDQGGLIFPGTTAERPLSERGLRQVLWRMARKDLTVHGFRSTFRDWCGEATSYPRDLAEAALAHTLKDKVEAAYRRGDLLERRRRLMEEWATFCAQPKPANGATVVPIRAAR
jgi:integrase